MSALRLTFARRAAPLIPYRSAAATRSFRSCGVLGAGKESALHNENRAEEAEAHKQDQLQKQREGKGHWKDELASDSESIVKADRNEMGSAKDNIEELQKETARLAKQEKDGKGV
ncbi:hypothetical protein B0A55_08195 [Friedmanniomyces simplex]|uniref:Uncharacterized protein n=1 Tax=Friedmanniomyces simplex TaxID=329884 RepID=A0A4U0WTT3_9PEZI|nr:hypothetical protein B0A55_08195 [Friedmanniomyces simplex]